MSLTRAATEVELVRRVGAWLTAAGLDGTTVNGTNAALASPIAWALRQSGYTVADPTTPADGDFAGVTNVDKLFDLAELRTLETIERNYTDVDSVAGVVEAKQDQLRQGIQRAIAEKRAQIQYLYGIGGAGAFAVAVSRNDGYTALGEL